MASERVEERTHYLSNGGLVSDISRLIHVREKRDTIFPRITSLGCFFLFIYLFIYLLICFTRIAR